MVNRVKVLVPEGRRPAYRPPEEGEERSRGRPKGSVNRLAMEAVARAKETGELPHEFLLRVARGEVISTDVMNPITGEVTKTYQVPELPMRVDAAKAAAPYFAPKLSAVEVMSGISDDALNQLIAGLATEAGIAVGSRGEGEAGEGQESATGQPAGSWL